MSTKFTVVFLTFIFNSLLSTPTFARACDDGDPTYHGCDTYGRLCKNGRVIGTCSTGNPRVSTEFANDASVEMDSGVEGNLSQLISNHRFESEDGFYTHERLSMHDLEFGAIRLVRSETAPTRESVNVYEVASTINGGSAIHEISATKDCTVFGIQLVYAD